MFWDCIKVTKDLDLKKAFHSSDNFKSPDEYEYKSIDRLDSNNYKKTLLYIKECFNYLVISILKS